MAAPWADRDNVRRGTKKITRMEIHAGGVVVTVAAIRLAATNGQQERAEDTQQHRTGRFGNQGTRNQNVVKTVVPRSTRGTIQGKAEHHVGIVRQANNSGQVGGDDSPNSS